MPSANGSNLAWGALKSPCLHRLGFARADHVVPLGQMQTFNKGVSMYRRHSENPWICYLAHRNVRQTNPSKHKWTNNNWIIRQCLTSDLKNQGARRAVERTNHKILKHSWWFHQSIYLPGTSYWPSLSYLHPTVYEKRTKLHYYLTKIKKQKLKASSH